MSKTSGTKWLSYYFGINLLLITVVTFFSHFFNISSVYTGGLILLILALSYLLIIIILAVPAQQEQQKEHEIKRNSSDDRDTKNSEIHKKLRAKNIELEREKNKLAGIVESATRDLEQIYSVFPQTAKAGNLQTELMTIEGSTNQLYRLIFDKFRPMTSGLIGLEENISYVYSLQLYKLVHNIKDIDLDEKRAILSDKCRELNGKLTFVKMVNNNLETTYNPDSHFCFDGNPGNNDIVKIHSFKIVNTRTDEILRKAAVSIGDIKL